MTLHFDISPLSWTVPHQHGLDGGHKGGLDRQQLPGPRAIGGVLLVPQHALNHIAQVTGGFEGIVGVGVHCVQAELPHQGNCKFST